MRRHPHAICLIRLRGDLADVTLSPGRKRELRPQHLATHLGCKGSPNGTFLLSEGMVSSGALATGAGSGKRSIKIAKQIEFPVDSRKGDAGVNELVGRSERI
jgi:hypothetical protein